jgi:hypothetical protein
MTTQQAPTPPPGNAELQYGLHHLVQHNNSLPYGYEGGDDGQPYLHSGQQSSAYSSPVPHMSDLRQHQPDQYLGQHYQGSPFSEIQGSPVIGMPVQYVSVWGTRKADWNLMKCSRKDMRSWALHIMTEMDMQSR